MTKMTDARRRRLVAQTFILFKAASRSASCSGRRDNGSESPDALRADCCTLELGAALACGVLALAPALVAGRWSLVLEPSFTAPIRYSCSVTFLRSISRGETPGGASTNRTTGRPPMSLISRKIRLPDAPYVR